MLSPDFNVDGLKYYGQWFGRLINLRRGTHGVKVIPEVQKQVSKYSKSTKHAKIESMKVLTWLRPLLIVSKYRL